MTTLSIVIPAYNEERGIADIAQRVLAVRPALARVGVSALELLVVDDGSRDGTADAARQVEGVRLIRHPVNRGYGAALKTGFHEAQGELIGFLDADGTYPPEYFPQLCEVAMNGHDLAIGSRMAGAESRMPLTRRLGNLFFAGLLSLIGRARVTDSASGMRVFKREILGRLDPLPDGLNLTPVMSARALHEEIRIAEIPIPYSERVGRSKLSVVRDGSVFLHSILWTVLAYNPVRILGLIGLGGMGLAVLLLGSTLLQRHFGSAGVIAAAAAVAMVEVHAAAASLAQLATQGQLTLAAAGWGLELLVFVAGVAKGALAFASGGSRYGWRVATGLVAAAAAMGLAHLVRPALGGAA